MNADAPDINKVIDDVHVIAALEVLTLADQAAARVQKAYEHHAHHNVPGYREAGDCENLLFAVCDKATIWLGQAVFSAAHGGAPDPRVPKEEEECPPTPTQS